MQLGVSSYSFSRLVQSGAINQLDVIQLVKNIGFEVIEFSALSLPEGETTLSFAPKIREACDEAGLPIVNYTVGADFIN
ncbi:MAG TPA: sugar phosphate isomerase/epimerase, partial [Candidatus Latescibacteria bacterium]|nr:sugar phosphate isomerase/epimerase [Candidatus Latescibacterota bacterium]